MKFCNKCGYRMDDNDRFCFNCGAPYSEPQAPAPQIAVAPRPVSMPQPIPVQVPVQSVEVKNPDTFEAAKTQQEVFEITGDLSPFKPKAQEAQGVTEMLKPAEVKVEKAYAVFTFIENGEKSEYRMMNKLINIGRSRENCEIVITWDKFVSRNHALVYTRNGRFFVVDLGSRNGVIVNDEKIDGIMELTGESKIKVAETEIVFKPEI